MTGRTIYYLGKKAKITEVFENKNIGGIEYNVYKIKSGRKEYKIKVDCFSGQAHETI